MDLVGLLELAHFALQRLQLLGLFGRNATELAIITFRLLAPHTQAVRGTAKLRRDHFVRS